MDGESTAKFISELLGCECSASEAIEIEQGLFGRLTAEIERLKDQIKHHRCDLSGPSGLTNAFVANLQAKLTTSQEEVERLKEENYLLRTNNAGYAVHSHQIALWKQAQELQAELSRYEGAVEVGAVVDYSDREECVKLSDIPIPEEFKIGQCLKILMIPEEK